MFFANLFKAISQAFGHGLQGVSYRANDSANNNAGSKQNGSECTLTLKGCRPVSLLDRCSKPVLD